MICRSSFAQSRSCTHRTRVHRHIGVNTPCVAPVPCCTLDHAVLSRQRDLQQNSMRNSLTGAALLVWLVPRGMCPPWERRFVQQLAEHVDQGTSTRKKTCCNTHTEVRIRADTNGTVLASAWIPLSLCTGHAVHFTWELPHIARIARARRRATQLLA